MTPGLVERIIVQAKDYGALALTPAESERLATWVAMHPSAGILTPSGVITIRDLPITILTPEGPT